MKASKDNATWQSIVYEQLGTDTDWVEYQGEIVHSAIELGYKPAESTGSLLAFSGWGGLTGKQVLVNDGNGIFQQYTMGTLNGLTGGIDQATYDVDVVSGISQYLLQDVAFSPDGYTVFTVDSSSDKIKKYYLTTPFDISTGNFQYHSSYLVNGKDTTPRSIAFSPDGYKMFMVGSTSDSVHQYILSNPFVIDSGVSFNFTFSVSGEDGNPSAIRFSPDGFKMFMTGMANDNIHQYNLTSSYDIATASHDHTIDIGTFSDPNGIAFSPDGYTMFLSTGRYHRIEQYELTTPFEISTATNSYKFMNVESQDTQPGGLSFNADGSKLIMAGFNSAALHQYSTNFSCSYNASFSSAPTAIVDIPPNTSQHIKIALASNVFGSSMPVVSSTTTSATLDYDNNIDEIIIAGDELNYESAIDYDIEDMSYDNITGNVSINAYEGHVYQMDMSPDGTKLIVMRKDSTTYEKIKTYNLSTPYDLSTLSSQSTSLSSISNKTNGLTISPDGFMLFVCSSSVIYQYTLSSSFDVSTVSGGSVASYSVAGQTGDQSNVSFSLDGFKMYVTDGEWLRIHQYSLTTPFRIENVSYDSVFLDISAQDSIAPEDLKFLDNGYIMLFLGGGGGVHQFELTTPHDLSTATYTGKTYSVTQEASPSSFVVSPDGQKMIVLGTTNDRAYQYTMSGGGGGALVIQSITVSNSQTSLEFSAVPIAPTSISLPDWSKELVADSFVESNGNVVQQSTRYMTSNGKRNVQFKLVGDNTSEILNAKINLWKEV